jgi:lipid-A-disaccharide synthase
MARRVFITVGEASGDQHAANLIRELRALDPSVVVEGLGGAEMAAAGAIVHHDTVSRAAMGWKSVLRYLEFRRLLAWTKNYFRQQPPSLQICIDSWSTNWHWARLAHNMNIPVMYYVAPQIWASRAGRIKRLSRYVDHVACILPFEEKVFRDGGVEATFVGHPLFDALPPRQPRNPAEHFPNGPPVIGLIPGSRSSVAGENFPHLLDVADHILQAYPKATFLIPTMSSTHEVVEKILQTKVNQAVAHEGELQTIGPYTLGMNAFDQLVSHCDLCISVSGTATLHAAMHGVPLIVVYRLSPLIWNLVGRWVVKTRTYSLVNLLNDTHQQIVPEFVPWYGSNTAVVEKALELLGNPKLLDEQRERLGHLIRTLNKPGASRQAAKIALDMMIARDKTVPQP